MADRGQISFGLASARDAPYRFKKNAAGILPQLDQLWSECLPFFDQRRVAEHAQTLGMSSLLCLGRHTVTGMLTTAGSQFQDWSAAYRLFSQGRVPISEIFSVVRRTVVDQFPPGVPLRAALDDSLLRRGGLHTPGVAWRRDPIGPRFQTNFVRAQRFLQVSAALPAQDGTFRMIPIAFQHAPTIPKPSKKASVEDLAQYRKDVVAARISLRAVQQITLLRQAMDQDANTKQRVLLISFDGGYTNSTVLKQIPANTICIGRIRKDAKLFFTPHDSVRKKTGRLLRYGSPAPTPEQFRTNDSEPWQTMQLQHAGVTHSLRFKRVQKIMWCTAGAHQILQLIIIAPLAYRPRKGAKLLYRDPAYLICTSTSLEPREIIEAYFQRWDIEVNFRDEKTLLGVGQAQVRAEASVESVPAFAVASYAMLLVAAARTFGNSKDGLLLQPKWASVSPTSRISTQRLIHQLRGEVWGRGLGIDSFSDFASKSPTNSKPKKLPLNLASAVCYANG